MSRLLLTGGTVLPMDAASRVISDGAVLIDDGVLAYVGPRADLGALPPATEVLDARDRLVLPGLVNTHTHVGMTFMRGLVGDRDSPEWFARVGELERHLTEQDLHCSALLGCVDLLSRGVTCVADRFSRMDIVAEAIAESGIRAVVGPSLYDIGRSAPLSAALDVVERWGVSPENRVSAGLAPVGADTSTTALLSRVRAAATEAGARIFIHVAQSRQEVMAIAERAGVTPVRYLADIGFLGSDVVAAHALYVDADDIRILADHGVSVAHCPASSARIEGRIAPVRQMLDRGVAVALGTDCAPSSAMDMFEEMRWAALLQKVGARGNQAVSPVEILRMATIRAAAALGLGAMVGSLEVGKQADVIVLDARALGLQPLSDVYEAAVHAVRSCDVREVFVAGRHLVSAGDTLGIDRDTLLWQARDWCLRAAAT